MASHRSFTAAVLGVASAALVGLAVAGLRLARRPRSQPASPADRQPPRVPERAAPADPPAAPGPRARDRPLTPFLLFLVALSLPFYLWGARPLPLPFNLPVGALVALVPASAASLASYREGGWRAVRALFARVLLVPQAAPRWGYLVALTLAPLVYVLSFGVMRLVGRPLPQPVDVPLRLVPPYLALFFVGGVGEELGWSGYALDPLQRRWGAARASLVLGAGILLWHTIPYVQTGNPAGWIIPQALAVLARRVLTTWLYNNTGRSVLAAVLFHDAENVAWALFPNHASHYDPLVTGALMGLAAGVVLALWEPRTLARLRRA